MKKNRFSIGVMDVALLALCLFLALGVGLVFHPCAPMEDGRWMTCHWAGQSVVGLGAGLSLLAAARLLMKNKAKIGADAGLILFSLLAALTPGNLIGLCSSPAMRCHTLTRPAALVASILIAAAAAIDIFLQAKRGDEKA